MDISLTRDARKVLKAIYDMYCDRRKSGQSKIAAVNFTASDAKKIAGYEDAKGELNATKMLKIFIYGDFQLTDNAIVFMENFTKDSILKWLEVGSNFIP